MMPDTRPHTVTSVQKYGALAGYSAGGSGIGSAPDSCWTTSSSLRASVTAVSRVALIGSSDSSMSAPDRFNRQHRRELAASETADRRNRELRLGPCPRVRVDGTRGVKSRSSASQEASRMPVQMVRAKRS
jgi:hypothetical protein